MEYIRREAQPVDKYDHQPRLYAVACEIATGLDYDDDVVFAAAWLHDIGVFLMHRPVDRVALEAWDNVAYAIGKIPELLVQFGFPQGKIPAVLEAVRTHQPHMMPMTMEAVILRDADILEQLGAIGILRAVSKIGRDTRYPTFVPVVQSLEHVLVTLPPLVRLPAAQAIAEPRIRVLEQFLRAVVTETKGPA